MQLTRHCHPSFPQTKEWTAAPLTIWRGTIQRQKQRWRPPSAWGPSEPRPRRRCVRTTASVPPTPNSRKGAARGPFTSSSSLKRTVRTEKTTRVRCLPACTATLTGSHHTAQRTTGNHGGPTLLPVPNGTFPDRKQVSIKQSDFTLSSVQMQFAPKYFTFCTDATLSILIIFEPDGGKKTEENRFWCSSHPNPVFLKTLTRSRRRFTQKHQENEPARRRRAKGGKRIIGEQKRFLLIWFQYTQNVVFSLQVHPQTA